MPYSQSGNLTTDKRSISETSTWSTQSDWQAYQSASNVEINNGVVSLAEVPPAQNDLFAHYDATELSLSNGESVSTWPDETGNGHDLTPGTAPSFVDSGIGGNPSVDFDLSDYLTVGFTEVTQPTNIYIVFSFNSVDASGVNIIYDSAVDQDTAHAHGNQNGEYVAFANTALLGGTPDTNEHISAVLFDGASSTIRIDGTQVASGDTGAENLNGFSVGNDRNNGGGSDVVIGEILVYPQDKSGIQSDVESYLSGKWGVTV